MGNPITNITIEGFKSIRELKDFELRNLNILIGPNGAGKSNFVSFFQFLKETASGYTQSYIKKTGGADFLLFMGTNNTHEITVKLEYTHGSAIWAFVLAATNTNSMYFFHEGLNYQKIPYFTTDLKWNLDESILNTPNFLYDEPEVIPEEIKEILRKDFIGNLGIYHFRDTGNFAAVKRSCTIRDYDYLRPDASNLAAFLLFLKKQYGKEYQQIRETVQLVAPFFDDFRLFEREVKDDILVLLEWQQKGSDYPFHPSQMSDGTLRFICLVTALLQPEPPSTILLDEPELGLHPHALALLAGLIKKASARTQVIVSTQSPRLIDYFTPEDIIVVEREKDESTFRRLPLDELKQWLDDYSIGELWEMNLLEGRSGE